MPFQLSPGVNVTEIDLTTVVPAVATTDGAIAGIFNWGPVGERVLIDSENKLVSTFGKPNSNNAETWFTAANFLGYGNRLYVVRAADTTTGNGNSAFNAIANTGTATVASAVVKNSADFNTHGSFDTDIFSVAKYPGALGNSLKISVCANTDAFSSVIDLSTQSDASLSINMGSNSGTLSAASNGIFVSDSLATISVGDYLMVGNATIGTQFIQVSAIGSVTGNSATISFVDRYKLSTDFTANSTVNSGVTRYWEYFNVVDTAPQQTDYVANFGNTAAIDGIHVVITDENGRFTGVPGTVIETYQNLSRATDAKTVGGADNYYMSVINNNSPYVWIVNDLGNMVSNTAAHVTSSSEELPITLSFNSGQDGYSESTATVSVLASGYDKFKSAEDVDISLVLQGKPAGGTTASGSFTANNFQLANYLIDNIVETRKDCVAFITPDDGIVYGNKGNEALALVAWRNVINDSSYAVIDSGYKYQYDRYNDVYRYIPSNGDVAGLCVRTDSTRDPWWSPAGFNRGQIKNVINMRYNPSKADRDVIYPKGINPIVSFPGQGTVLYGDKTAQSKPSAFDHINVRRLFIVLEKAIATAAKFTLFEFNDAFTRAQFKSLITPYLRDVQSRRGITDFLVVCDETNNTPERIDRNEFWGDIYIKPARSINYIQLNFVAVRTGVQFSEVVGQF
jgi:phage tail sheath protein FI